MGRGGGGGRGGGEEGEKEGEGEKEELNMVSIGYWKRQQVKCLSKANVMGGGGGGGRGGGEGGGGDKKHGAFVLLSAIAKAVKIQE